MTALSLDLFTQAPYDFERAQYRVLAGLRHVEEAFSSNQIYPHLGELIQLYRTLKTILERTEDLKGALPKQIKDVDLKEKKIVYEWPELDQDEMADVEELIRWALPRIQTAIEEGRSIFEFVDENLHLEEVGLVPSYKQEGYFLIPDREAEALHILQYSLSIFTSADEQYRSLRTSHLRSLPHRGVYPSPQRIKLDLVEERRNELPNPATYFIDTDLVFPFEPTVFPVAKRKLMRHLYEEDSGGGQA